MGWQKEKPVFSLLLRLHYDHTTIIVSNKSVPDTTPIQKKEKKIVINFLKRPPSTQNIKLNLISRVYALLFIVLTETFTIIWCTKRRAVHNNEYSRVSNYLTFILPVPPVRVTCFVWMKKKIKNSVLGKKNSNATLIFHHSSK